MSVPDTAVRMLTSLRLESGQVCMVPENLARQLIKIGWAIQAEGPAARPDVETAAMVVQARVYNPRRHDT